MRLWQWGAPRRFLDVGDLAGSLSKLPGAPSEPPASAWGVWLVTAVALASGVALIAIVVDRTRQSSPIGRVVLANAAWQLVAVEVLWLYHDRYYLPLLPALLYLVVRGLPRPSPAMIVTAVVLIGVSVSGAIDHFRLANTVAAARGWLLAQGAAAYQIDAGYAANGWWLYAHPENLPPGADLASDVPSVTTRAPTAYSISSSPRPGHEILRVFPFRSWWTDVDRVYVLKRLDAPALSSSR